jgi:hypothetical protein
LEPVGFWENTATYVQSQVFPMAWGDTQIFFRYFQGQPHLPLDYGVQSGEFPYYMYGGSLWIYIMEFLYGSSNPLWIADVWSGCIEESGLNEPDYFDVLSDRLQGEGGFWEMVPSFAQYRYFIGVDGDGQHVPKADGWLGSEVAQEQSWTQVDLPVVDQEPSYSTAPQPNGCNFVVMDTHEEKEIAFTFSGEPDVQWNVDVMRVRQGEETTSSRMDIDEQGSGQIEASAGPDVKFVMVVCHLAGEDYDPDAHSWKAAMYTYSIEKKQMEPQIQVSVPDVLYRGDQNVLVSIIGTDFVDHDALTFRVMGGGVQISGPAFVASTTITGKAAVSEDAALGARDVALLLPDGTELVGQGLIRIASHEEVADAGDNLENSDGCDCRSAGFETRRSLLSLLL